jgi:predicted nucleotidyltransferase
VARYQINTNLIQKELIKQGFKNLNDFLSIKKINRMTFYNYLKGQGGPIAEPYYEICRHLHVDPLWLLQPQKKAKQAAGIQELAEKIARKDCRFAIGLFGSRAKKTAKKYSDWDIGITKGPQGLSAHEYFSLKTFVSDLVDDWPQSVDVINLDQAPPWFLKGIDYKPIFLGGNQESWIFFEGVLYGTKRKD